MPVESLFVNKYVNVKPNSNYTVLFKIEIKRKL